MLAGVKFKDGIKVTDNDKDSVGRLGLDATARQMVKLTANVKAEAIKVNLGPGEPQRFRDAEPAEGDGPPRHRAS